jgi:hypothetical protein
VLMEALMHTVQVNCDVDGTTVTMQRRLACTDGQDVTAGLPSS